MPTKQADAASEIVGVARRQSRLTCLIAAEVPVFTLHKPTIRTLVGSYFDGRSGPLARRRTVLSRLSRRSFLAVGGSAAVLATSRPVVAQTCSETRETLSFLVVGDWGHAPDSRRSTGQREVARAMAAHAQMHGIDFVISTGDNFYPAGVSDVADRMFKSAFEDIYSAKSLQRPWYLVLGNHDRDGRPMAQVAYGSVSERWNLPSPFYRQSIDFAGGRALDIFFLDTTKLIEKAANALENSARAVNDEQLDWLELELSASRADWKIVVGHHPVYSGGKHGNNSELKEYLEPIFIKHRVNSYFNGHDHDLQHIVVDGIHYFTSGGGADARSVRTLSSTQFAAAALGFLAFRLSTEKMLVEFVNADNEMLYSASISRDENTGSNNSPFASSRG